MATSIVNIPSQYATYVADAAKTLGIPEDVVGAQIQLESDWDPNVVSPAGAEGIAQFEPGTFASYGLGSPFNVTDAFAAYTKYMGALLKQEGGSVQKALEAYNAGPGNLSAGSGYANTILTNAGVSEAITAAGNGINAIASGTASNDQSGGLLSIPGDITGFFSDATDDITSAVSFFHLLFSPTTYLRVGAGLVGIFFFILTLVFLYKESGS
jgi:hypothetical protein